MKKEDYEALAKSTEEQLQKITDGTKRLRHHLQSLRCEDVDALADLEGIVRQLLGAISERSQKRCPRCPFYPNYPENP